jgi:sulfite reductase (NADPH) flavoprotein alpha-component
MTNTLNILYASMWGNAEDLAFELKELAENNAVNKYKTVVKELNDVSMDELKEMKRVAIITSTTGHGDMPTNGEAFWDALSTSKDLDLSNVQYSVLALGDSSHELFCNAGRKVDEQMVRLRARRVLDRTECDGDTTGYEDWSSKLLQPNTFQN